MAWYTVVLLSISYLIAMIDRIILSMIVGPIKADLVLTDMQMGLLLGTAFGLFYSVMGLPMGRLVDRLNRRNLIIAGLVGWSVMTIASGFAENYWQLFIARMGVGIGEAILAPAAWSMIADLFPPHKRAKPVGVFYIGGTVGVGLALVASTWFLTAASSSEVIQASPLAGLSAWRIVLIMAGLPGLVVALLLLTIREPSRIASDGSTEGGTNGAQPTLRNVAAYVWSNRGALLLFYVGMGFVALTAYSTMSWAPTALVREFDVSITEVGYLYGMVILLVTPWATPLGGAITDRQAAKSNYRVFIQLPMLCVLGIALTHLAFGYAATLTVAIVALGAFNFFYYAAQAPAAGYTLQIVPSNMRGLVSALYVLVINLIGLMMGPPIVAMVSTALDPSGQSLALALAIVCGISAVIGVVCLWKARVSAYKLFESTPALSTATVARSA